MPILAVTVIAAVDNNGSYKQQLQLRVAETITTAVTLTVTLTNTVIVNEIH